MSVEQLAFLFACIFLVQMAILWFVSLTFYTVDKMSRKPPPSSGNGPGSDFDSKDSR